MVLMPNAGVKLVTNKFKWVIYLRRFNREFLKAHPEARFVFGDNTIRQGFGGQAKECRGEPNAIGVATKALPTMDPDAFFADTQANLDVVLEDLREVEAAFKEGRQIYAPADGLGTGLAELPQRAPLIYMIIRRFFEARSLNHSCPWPASGK
jgi:hypothetical protein